MIKISINDKEFEVKSESELIEYFDDSLKFKFVEIWISGHGEATLATLINSEKKKAFLMFQDLENEEYFNSVELKGNNNLTMDFLLCNGQMDEYPVNWVVDIEKAKESVLEYYASGKMWNGIEWMES